MNEFFVPYQDTALLVLRVVVGVIFLAHGWMKANPKTGGLKGFGQMMSQMMKMPEPLGIFVGYSHGLVEIIGGALMVLGLLTRIWAIPFAIIMLLAILAMKIPMEGANFIAGEGEMTGWEFDLMILAGVVVLLVFGGGAYGLDAILGFAL